MYKRHNRRLSKTRRYFMELLSVREENIKVLIEKNAKKDEEIAVLYEEKLNMQKEICELKRESDHLNSIQKHLNQIHMKAQADALNLIDSAKEEAMDTLKVVDTFNEKINVLKRDMKLLQKDLSVGTSTVEKRIEEFEKELYQVQYELSKIKLDFYRKNDIPIFEDDRRIGSEQRTKKDRKNKKQEV